MGGMKKDFFISYTGADVRWAQWIGKTLEAAGYKVVLQDWDFEPGCNFVVEMDKALKECERTLGVLSPAYLAQSPYGYAEWAATFAGDPVGSERKLVLVRVEPCEPQGLLKPISYIDLASLADEGLAQEKLLSSFEPSRRGDDPAIVFPGAVAQSETESRFPNRFPGTLPTLWNLPFRRNPNFTGRKQPLEDMAAAVEAGLASAVCQAIKGMGGVGKSQLAAEYAYRHQSVFDMVWWVRSESQATLEEDLVALGRRLGLPLPEDSQLAAQRTRRALESECDGRPWCVVFDNVEDPELVAGYLPRGGQGALLLTSRDQRDWGALAKTLKLDLWSEQECVDFLRTRLELGEQEVAEAQALARDLGQLPLALEQAAAYVNTTGESVAEYRGIFHQQKLLVLAERSWSDSYQETVATTWSLALARLEREAPTSLSFLRLLSQLAPDAISLSTLHEYREALPEALSRELSQPLQAKKLVEALQAYSLLEREGDALSMHRLVQLVVRETAAEASENWPQLAVLWLEAASRVKEEEADDVQHWPRLEPLASHALEAVKRLRKDSTHPACWKLGLRFGLYYRSRAQYVIAEELMRLALSFSERICGPNDPEVASTLVGLGHLLSDVSRLPEAERLLRRALEIVESSKGTEHPDVAMPLNNLASVLRDTNRLCEAEALLRRALSIREASYGADHPHVAGSLSNLASVLSDKNRLSEAELLHRRALSIHEASYGADHPRVALSLSNLAENLRETNRLSEAEPLCRRALSILEASYGADHPDVAMSLNNLGAILRLTKRRAEAESMIQRALEVLEASLGEHHPSTAKAMNNLASLLLQRKRLVEAERLLQRALGAFEKSYGPDHPDVGLGLNNLASVLVSLNRKKEAKEKLHRAVTIFTKSLGKKHPTTQTALRNYKALRPGRKKKRR